MNPGMTDVAPSSSVICDKGVEAVKRAMIERVAHSEEHFVHLRQRDEPDMSFDERLALVEKLLANNPGEFIARFGCTFTVEDLLYFDTFCSSDYIVNFWTREIRQRLNESGTKLHQTVIKNRRYVTAFTQIFYRLVLCRKNWGWHFQELMCPQNPQRSL